MKVSKKAKKDLPKAVVKNAVRKTMFDKGFAMGVKSVKKQLRDLLKSLK